ncbi:MAG: hypothetical protein CMC39_01720, partial [Flavobacteriaceae bacterium]|nr:hypothetical protein [Flavobacteriaceae bacterium]
MNRLLLIFILLVSIHSNTYSQDDFETWPISWDITDSGINVTQETTIVYEGSSSASVEVTTASQGSTDWRKNVNLNSGTTYTISFKIYHTEGGVRARIYAGTYRNYSQPTTVNQWQTLSYDYVPSSTGSHDIGLRFYDVSGFDGNEVVYVDDFKIISDVTYSSDTSISSDLTYNNVTINSGVTLTIEKNGSLTTLGNLSNSGTLIINSDNLEFGSLIVQGTSSGNATYNRWINSISSASPTSSDPGWDLVGSPVVGASLTSSNFSQNSGNYAIQPYDNSDNTWTATSSATVSTSLGTGYAMAKQTAGTEAFTGTIETIDKNVSITNNDGSGSGTQWNLVANPYPSYLALNSNARSASSATTDFITQNAETADVLGSGTNEDALWYWKGFEYGQYNNSSSAKYIAPGQGFFVASKTGGGTLKFLESMQTTTGTDDFISGDIMEDNRGELFISLNQNDLLRETEIYFIENTTDGSDPTYDARTFPMNDNATSVFTRLVEGDEGVDLAIQSLAY